MMTGCIDLLMCKLPTPDASAFFFFFFFSDEHV